MKRKSILGFSLIELMIVVTIAGILAAIAYPSYSQYVIRSRRSEATAALLDLSARMERFFTENNTYATATIATAAATDVLTSATTQENWYTLSISAQNATTYTIQAAPNGVQATADTECASFTYSNLGIRGITGTGVVNTCW